MKSTKWTRPILASAVAAVLCAPAYVAAQAAQGQGQQLPEFSQVDRDSDGYIVPPEAQGTMDPRQFQEADQDRDMRLSRQEYQQAGGQMQAQAGGQQGGQPPMDPQQMAQQQEQMSEQQGMAQRGGGQQEAGGAQITVKERPAQVQIEQQPPKVIVEQQSPDIAVTQPKPQVSVQQPEPEVQVQQAQTDVQVQEKGQPQVSVREGGQPDVQYREAQREREMQGQETAQVTGETDIQTAGTISGQLQNMTVEQISGMDVLNQNGDDLGSVEKLVRSRDDGQLYAVVSVGGFLGIGDSKVAWPVQEMELLDNQLLAQTGASVDELKQRQYNRQLYDDIREEQATLAELSGGTQPQPTGGTQVSFSELDRDNDGRITPPDVQQYDELRANWNQLDANSDGVVDQAEFAAFEQTGGGQQGGTQGGGY